MCPLKLVLFSKLLRPEKRVNQINEKAERSDAGDNIVHGIFLLELVAGLGEGPADS
jgi:hypothetical protein